MSTIRVDNFGPSAGGTTYSAGGIAKAWVNFNGTGTVAIRDSENVSSLTDLGTGRYRPSYSNAMSASLNYGITSSSNSGVADIYGGENINTSFGTYVTDYSGTSVDHGYLLYTIHGDLA